MTDRSPSDIARETFKLLAGKRLPPTPENYQALYHEVAGTLPPAYFPSEQLRHIASQLPERNLGQSKHVGLLRSAIEQRNWTKVGAALVGYAGFAVAVTPAPTSPLVDAPDVAAAVVALQEQVARLIESAQPALGQEDARFSEQLREMVLTLRQPPDDLATVKTALGNFAHRLSFAAEDQAEIKASLLKLLRLVMESLGELHEEDGWLHGQVEALLEAMAPPLDLRRLDSLERGLRDVLFKQTEARGRAIEAKAEMRQLLATFVERLSQMTESSATYHGKIEQCARLIEQAHSLEDLGPVLHDVMDATRVMARDVARSRDELQTMREKTEQAESRIAQLHEALDRASALARHDTLTGALNRRGLDEAVVREIATARRKGQDLCVALLDVDDFKRVNDELGHTVGDAALQHLAEVARQSLRPQDSLARFGGEEFVIVLPDTALDAAIAALTRLQRELTTRYFLSGTRQLLITFSAGVAQFGEHEEMAEALQRADHAMYLAKRAGKNRVLGG